MHISTTEGYIGASLDRLVLNGDGKLCGCIEIKCPNSVRDKILSDACSQSQFSARKTSM